MASRTPKRYGDRHTTEYPRAERRSVLEAPSIILHHPERSAPRVRPPADLARLMTVKPPWQPQSDIEAGKSEHLPPGL